VRTAGEKYFNSVYLVLPGEPPYTADKRHLVPFGEYVPPNRCCRSSASAGARAGDFSAPRIELLPGRGAFRRRGLLR
jgi:apolipoprotein N-acyltransferase